MRTKPFPLNYFLSVWSVRNIIRYKGILNWLQIILVLFFLNGLMMMPVSLNYNKLTSFSIDQTYPGPFELLNEQFVNEIQTTSVLNSRLTSKETFIEKNNRGVVGINMNEKQLKEALEKEQAFVLQQNEIIIKDREKPVEKVYYPKEFSFEHIDTIEDVKKVISNLWFMQNKVYIIGTLLFVSFTILLSSLLLIVTGCALFLYISKRTTSIQNFKEAMNLILNCLAIPTVLAMVVGLFHFNIMTMMIIQMIGFLILLVYVFFNMQIHHS